MAPVFMFYLRLGTTSPRPSRPNEHGNRPDSPSPQDHARGRLVLDPLLGEATTPQAEWPRLTMLPESARVGSSLLSINLNSIPWLHRQLKNRSLLTLTQECQE